MFAQWKVFRSTGHWSPHRGSCYECLSPLRSPAYADWCRVNTRANTETRRGTRNADNSVLSGFTRHRRGRGQRTLGWLHSQVSCCLSFLVWHQWALQWPMICSVTHKWQRPSQWASDHNIWFSHVTPRVVFSDITISLDDLNHHK